MNPNNANQLPTPAQIPGMAPGQQPQGYGQYGPQPAVASGPGYVPVPPPAGAQPMPMPPPQMTPQASPSGGQVLPQQKSKVPAKTNPNSTQNSLQIAEIRDGIVIMNDGSFRSVVMVKSVNFDLMSPEERDGVEFSYQGFLNSLYFPVQIFIHSQKVDLRPYIEKLDKIRSEHDNMLLALLMEDYIAFMSDLASQTNIMDKHFYVVIPFFPTADLQKALTSTKGLFSGLGALFSNKQQHVTINEADLEKAKAELRNRVQAVLGGLMQCGVQGLPLDTQELIELYYDSYNPDTATRQELKNFNDLVAPVITKGVGQAYQPGLDKELES